jgi:hypothetical protein
MSRDQRSSENETVEMINAGSLQRIADAVEKMAGNYDSLLRSKKWAEERAESLSKANDRAFKQIAGYRGYIKSLKGGASK